MGNTNIWFDICVQTAGTKFLYYYKHFEAMYQFPVSINEELQIQTLTFIGDDVKTSCIKRLGLPESATHGKAQLVTSRIIEDSSAILVADCELHNHKFRNSGYSRNLVRCSLEWQNTSEMDKTALSNAVYARLIYPFSNIICLIEEDLGGMRGVSILLASWLQFMADQSPDLPLRTRPRILVLRKWDELKLGIFDESTATREFAQDFTVEAKRQNGRFPKGKLDLLVEQLVAHLKVLAFASHPSDVEEMSEEDVRFHLLRLDVSWSSLRRRLLQESKDVQCHRRNCQVAFSATHFGALFELACIHFSRSERPFSYILASRVENPVSVEFPLHIAEFLRKIPTRLHLSFGAPIIASALSLDSFPPGMHIFNTIRVFDTNYYEMLSSLKTVIYPNKALLHSKMQHRVRFCFCQQNTPQSRRLKPAAAAHAEMLATDTLTWQSTFSSKSCFSCLARSSGIFISCGHSFCDSCIIIHGSAQLTEPWNLILKACPLCKRSNDLLTNLKPYTAGIRAITFDRNAPRDIRILKEIETQIRLEIPIWECFDIAFGRGTGGLILLGIFCSLNNYTRNDWVDKCFTILQCTSGLANLPTRFSTTEKNSSLEWCYKLKTHASKALEAVLDRITSKNSKAAPIFRAAFGNSQNLLLCSGKDTKLGLLIKQKDYKRQVISNFKRKMELQTINLKQIGKSGQLLVWKIAEKLAKDIVERTEGTDLAQVTLLEQDMLWTRRNKDPDILLRLGVKEYEAKQNMHSFICDYRLGGEELPIKKSADRILASLFYLEMDGLPFNTKNGFICRAQILCRLSPQQLGLQVLVRLLLKSKACFLYSGLRTACIDDEILQSLNNGCLFAKNIGFIVYSLQESIDVRIDKITEEEQQISNCPYQISTLLEDQGLNCNFGHKDHRKRIRRLALEEIQF